MFIATWVFWLGRHDYVHVPPAGSQPHSVLKVLWSGFKSFLNRQGFWPGAEKYHPAEAIDGVKAVLGVTGLFVWISVFWALFDQSGSTWTLQAKNMNLYFAGIEWSESQIQALNPIMILFLIPFCSKIVYPLSEKMGFNLTPTRKMSAGMLLAAFSFVLIGLIQSELNAGNKLNVAWQFWPYLIMTISEVLVSITGLEFSYTQAPRAMKSTLMSFWLLTVFFGNSMTAIISKLNRFHEGSVSYFMFFALLMGAMALIFTFMTSRYKMRNYMEDK
jgi:POT family proton-dependent oligopeptide transporter